MDKFTIGVEKISGGYVARCRELPGSIGFSENLSDACRDVSNLIELYIQNQGNELLSQPDNAVLPEKIIDPDQKLDEVSAAKFLNIGRSSLRRLRAQKLIEYFHYNRRAYFSVEQLQQYQNRHLVQSITSKTRMRRG